MRILITSGGTKVPIDPVRHIGNSSQGRFGSHLATSALKAGLDVIYLVSKEGQSPFSQSVEFYNDYHWEHKVAQLKNFSHFCHQYRKHYREYHYHNFMDYHETLQSLIEREQPEVVILAAAVSDYLVANYSDEKIRSNEKWVIELTTAPKIIHAIKQWLPYTFLVGFKLLIDATDAELAVAAIKGMEQHQADLVVANNLSSIRHGAHEILLVERDGSYNKYTHDLANAVISRSLRGFN